MNASLSQITRVMTRRTRSGQSIIIIAFAFIALIAFVGIATDVAMLFVRFSALRRAVDAGAVAAAGQIRKNANYLNMQAIAEQFIKVHGIDPTTVKVETCETEIADYITAHPPLSGSNPGDIPTARTALMNGTARSELCTPTAQKLVRVSAQMDSPTSFLAIVGWKTVRLSTSSLSQTAELDVALLLDTSLSESLDTQTAQYSGYYQVGTPSTSSNYPNQFYNTGGVVGTDINPAKGSALTAYGGTTGGACASAAAAPYDTAQTTSTFNTGYNPGDCNNADSLRYFRDFTNPSPTNTSPTATNGAVFAQQTVGYLANPRAPNARWGVNLQPAPSSYINTTDYTVGDLTRDSYGQSWIRYECWYDPSKGNSSRRANYAWAGCCNDPTIQSDTQSGYLTTFDPTTGTGFNPDPNWYLYDDDSLSESIINDQANITTNSANFKVYDSAGNLTSQFPVARLVAGGRNWKEVGTQPISPGSALEARYGAPGQYGSTFASSPYLFNGGDGNYSALICQPFKQVRDAARRFINRMDFVRGDRLVLITFDSAAKDITPYGQTVPIITDKTVAIQTLNMKVGVEVSPSHNQNGCNTQYTFQNTGNNPGDWMGQKIGSADTTNNGGYYVDAYNPQTGDNSIYDYYPQSQCVDTNTGGGILLGNKDLTDPNYVRRDSVWVMVVLSDGYPNRTPPMIGAGSNIGGHDNSVANSPPERENLQVLSNSNAGLPQVNGSGQIDASQPIIRTYCDPANASTYGTRPQYCALAAALGTQGNAHMGWGPRFNDPTKANYTQLVPYVDASYWSFGFCPYWTFCTSGNRPLDGMACNSDPSNANNTNNDTDTANWPWTGGAENASPVCTDNDPNSRHFCMEAYGHINGLNVDPPGQTTQYQCDRNYDAMDYAMDMTDYAALQDYTSKSKGNFIAMYSNFFQHSALTPAAVALNQKLGSKMLRYISDAGDNGVIDNAVQHWYRDMRDNFQGQNPGITPASGGVNPPPYGGNCVGGS